MVLLFLTIGSVHAIAKRTAAPDHFEGISAPVFDASGVVAASAASSHQAGRNAALKPS